MQVATDSRRGLWNAVIQQALSDATSESQDPEARRERSRARAWFESMSADFAEVCELAGFEPSQVRRIALDHIAAIDTGTRGKTYTRRLITHAGETLSVSEWSKRTGLQCETLLNRIRAGWTYEQVVTLPKGARPSVARVRQQPLPTHRATRTKPRARRTPTNLITFNGTSLTVSGWAKRVGIGRTALHNRLKQGWPLERALTEGPAPMGPCGEPLEFNGEALPAKEWAKRLGIPVNTFQKRLSRSGRNVGLALTMPKGRGRSTTPSEISHH